MCQEYALAEKMSSSVLDCLRLREMILLLSLSLVTHSWSAKFSSALLSKREKDIWEQVHQKARKMIKRLKHLTHEERLKELRLFSLEQRRLKRILPMCINT